MMRPLEVVIGAAAVIACSSPAAERPSAPDRDTAPAAEPAGAAGRLDLAWDRGRGWEPRRPRSAAGSGEVPRDAYVHLGDLPMDDPALLRTLLTSGRPLRDMAIIAVPAEVCAPSLAAVVAEEKPDRLLLRIEGGMTAGTVDCLDRLETPRLYLAMCPNDGTTMWRCDGDAELAALARGRTLSRRLRGLAISVRRRGSWRQLATFAALEYLTVRGAALDDIDAEPVREICRRTSLQALDVLDAERSESALENEPACIFSRESFGGWRVRDLPPPAHVPCRLRRLRVWELDQAMRDRLRTACPDLEEIDTVE